MWMSEAIKTGVEDKEIILAAAVTLCAATNSKRSSSQLSSLNSSANLERIPPLATSELAV